VFDNEELPETFLPVTPVYRVLSADASTLRIVEAHDQKVKIGVTDLGCDLVELAMMHHREIDVEVDPGKWIRVRPDGSMMPAPRPVSLDCFAKLKRRRARRDELHQGKVVRRANFACDAVHALAVASVCRNVDLDYDVLKNVEFVEANT